MPNENFRMIRNMYRLVSLSFVTLSYSFFLYPTNQLVSRHKAFVLNVGASLSASEEKRISSFDSDFAEAISKPLPKWFREAEAERETLLKEMEKNRERIMQEFKAKYEVSEEKKREEQTLKWNKIKEREEQKKKQKEGWMKQAARLFSKEETTLATSTTAAPANELTTKEKWENFLEEEEKQTGFYLPGFFEVFPELKFRWPVWLKNKDGAAVECEVDNDCPFPMACCAHPIIPGQSFCCSGWTKREMVPIYVMQESKHRPMPSNGKGSGNMNTCMNEY